jgi:hypothetical protein
MGFSPVHGASSPFVAVGFEPTAAQNDLAQQLYICVSAAAFWGEHRFAYRVRRYKLRII